MKLFTKLILCALMCLFIFPDMVFAQVATPAPTNDVADVLNSLIKIAGVVLLAIGSWAGFYLKSWVAAHAKFLTAQQLQIGQDLYEKALGVGIGYAEKLEASIVIGPDDQPRINNTYLETAAAYVKKYWPDMTKDKTLQDIKNSITARLPVVLVADDAPKP